eukprot:gene5614-4034_t
MMIHPIFQPLRGGGLYFDGATVPPGPRDTIDVEELVFPTPCRQAVMPPSPPPRPSLNTAVQVSFNAGPFAHEALCSMPFGRAVALLLMEGPATGSLLIPFILFCVSRSLCSGDKKRYGPQRYGSAPRPRCTPIPPYPIRLRLRNFLLLQEMMIHLYFLFLRN